MEHRLYCANPSGVGDTNGFNGRTSNAELKSVFEKASEITAVPINIARRSQIAAPGDEVYIRPPNSKNPAAQVFSSFLEPCIMAIVEHDWVAADWQETLACFGVEALIRLAFRPFALLPSQL